MKAITTALTLIITLAALNSHAANQDCPYRRMKQITRDNAKTAYFPATMAVSMTPSSESAAQKR